MPKNIGPGALLGLAGVIPNPTLAHAPVFQGGLNVGIGTGGGPLSGSASPALQAVQQQATQYRPPTQKYERSVFGNHFRDTTPEERSGYNVAHLQDRRNVGHGQGQVDPGLAQAAIAKEGGGENGGGK